jgi:hypothetical protein
MHNLIITMKKMKCHDMVKKHLFAKFWVQRYLKHETPNYGQKVII